MSKSIAIVSFASIIVSVIGHGAMNVPPARNAGVNATTQNEGGCQKGACQWFSQGCALGCGCNGQYHPCNSTTPPTIMNPKYRTYNRELKAYKEECFFNPNVNRDTCFPAVKKGEDYTEHRPWRSPGSIIPLNPCGLAGGSTYPNDEAGGFGNQTVAGKQGYPGTKLQRTKEHTVWKRGNIVEVSWGITANHGGGYQYRLCPVSEKLTEQCFQKTILPFHGSKQKLRWSNGHEVTIDATRVSEGTTPKGSTWTMNPIPACDATVGGYDGIGCDKPQFPPPPGCNETCWGLMPCVQMVSPKQPCKTIEIPAIVDEIEIPADLAEGDYIIGFRWDVEQTPQIWASCGDVTLK
eukprot:m.4894 g.4894  ORF g.4894 m.4894 type:complete len:350 (+) comp3128_c0_seq1:97-1146(+)